MTKPTTAEVLVALQSSVADPEELTDAELVILNKITEDVQKLNQRLDRIYGTELATESTYERMNSTLDQMKAALKEIQIASVRCGEEQIFETVKELQMTPATPAPIAASSSPFLPSVVTHRGKEPIISIRTGDDMIFETIEVPDATEMWLQPVENEIDVSDSVVVMKSNEVGTADSGYLIQMLAPLIPQIPEAIPMTLSPQAIRPQETQSEIQWCDLDWLKERGTRTVESDKPPPLPPELEHVTAAGGTETPWSQTSVTELTTVGEGRGTVLSLKLDRLSDSVSGLTVVEPKGYLTDLKSLKITSDAEISDIKKARLLLQRAVECCPLHVEVWIALAHLEPYEYARRVLNRARVKLIKELTIGITAAKLEEANGNTAMVEKIIGRGIKTLQREGLVIDREEWMKEAEAEAEANEIVQGMFSLNTPNVCQFVAAILPHLTMISSKMVSKFESVGVIVLWEKKPPPMPPDATLDNLFGQICHFLGGGVEFGMGTLLISKTCEESKIKTLGNEIAESKVFYEKPVRIAHPLETNGTAGLPAVYMKSNGTAGLQAITMNGIPRVQAANKTAGLQAVTTSAKPKYRPGYYQKPEEVVVTIFAKHVPPTCIEVDFGKQMLSVLIHFPEEEPYHFEYVLFGEIVPANCKYEVLTRKVEIRLAKATLIYWTSLEYIRSQKKNDSAAQRHHIDWDKLEAEVKEKENIDGCINGWNGKVAELTGVSVEDAMGMPLVNDLVCAESKETVETNAACERQMSKVIEDMNMLQHWTATLLPVIWILWRLKAVGEWRMGVSYFSSYKLDDEDCCRCDKDVEARAAKELMFFWFASPRPPESIVGTLRTRFSEGGRNDTYSLVH